MFYKFTVIISCIICLHVFSLYLLFPYLKPIPIQYVAYFFIFIFEYKHRCSPNQVVPQPSLTPHLRKLIGQNNPSNIYIYIFPTNRQVV